MKNKYANATVNNDAVQPLASGAAASAPSGKRVTWADDVKETAPKGRNKRKSGNVGQENNNTLPHTGVNNAFQPTTLFMNAYIASGERMGVAVKMLVEGRSNGRSGNVGQEKNDILPHEVPNTTDSGLIENAANGKADGRSLDNDFGTDSRCTENVMPEWADSPLGKMGQDDDGPEEPSAKNYSVTGNPEEVGTPERTFNYKEQGANNEENVDASIFSSCVLFEDGKLEEQGQQEPTPIQSPRAPINDNVSTSSEDKVLKETSREQLEPTQIQSSSGYTHCGDTNTESDTFFENKLLEERAKGQQVQTKSPRAPINDKASTSSVDKVLKEAFRKQQEQKNNMRNSSNCCGFF